MFDEIKVEGSRQSSNRLGARWKATWIAFLCCLLVAEFAFGQERTTARHKSQPFHRELEPNGHPCVVSLGRGGAPRTLEVRVPHSRTDVDIARIELPLELCGDFQQLRGGTFLVCGREGNEAVFVRVRIETAPASIRVEETWRHAGYDAVGVAWNERENRVYFLDADTRDIHALKWDALRGHPEWWTVSRCVGPEQSRLLDSSTEIHMGPARGNRKGIHFGHGAYVSWLHAEGNEWVLEPVRAGSADEAQWIIRNPLEEVTTEGFFLRGRGGPFQVVERDSGRVVHEGRHVDPESWQYVAPSPPLQPGKIHTVRDPEGVSEIVIHPLLRQGSAGSTGRLSLTRGRTSTLASARGFQVPVLVEYQVERPVPERLELLLLSAFRPVEGEDPIVTRGPYAWLVPEFVVPFSFKTFGRSRGGRATRIDFPHVPQTLGRVVLFQVVSIDARGETEAFTSVFGTTLR